MRVEKDEIPVELNVFQELGKYEISLDVAKQVIKNNRHNNISTIYYLLLQKRIKENKPLKFDTDTI